MARDWRRLVIAAAAAAAMAAVHTAGAAAQDQEQGAEPKAAAKKKQDPVEAQRVIEAARKLIDAGKADQAVVSLSSTLAGGNLPPAIMAKALLFRGMAYRQQKKPAQAIADLTSALWLKGGLGEGDRKDALQQRIAAYQEAGLTETGAPANIAQAPSPRPQRTVTSGPSWGAETTWQPGAQGQAQSASSGSSDQGSGGWNLFANLFGGSPSPPQPAPTPPPAPVVAAPRPVAPTPPPAVEQPPAIQHQAQQHAAVGSAWSSNTEVQPTSAHVVTGALPTRPEGRYRIQVGIVRTQAEADALAVRMKREHADLLAGRETEIDQAVVGNMGSFYRVRLGPFASQQETNGICARLKGTGIDCLVVTQ